MGAVVYRAASRDTLICVTLDILTAIFHRPSGITHLVIAPAPEILAALGDGPLSADALLAKLATDYDLGESGALSDRLGELVAAGLVETAAG